jgi:ATP-dependent RNA helicase DeaD
VEVNEEQIEPFMDVVNKKLEWLSKEEIIKHFLSLEFNRFIEYYKDAKDLNEPTARKGRHEKDDAERGGRRGERGERGERRRRSPGGSFKRFFINIGKKDGIGPKNMIGLINDSTGDRDINIGAIDIKDNFSFFEVGDKYAANVMNSLNNQKFQGRKIHLDYAEDSPNRSSKKGNRRKRI